MIWVQRDVRLCQMRRAGGEALTIEPRGACQLRAQTRTFETDIVVRRIIDRDHPGVRAGRRNS